MKTLAERLAWARNEKQLSQQQLADLAGVSQSTIGNLEAGIRSSARKITSIASALGVSAAWLADGQGEASDPSLPPVLPHGGVQVHVYENGDADYIEIKKVKLKLSAGVTGYAIEKVEENGAPITFRKDWLAKNGYFPEDLIAIKVKGDSMEPALYEGDTVVINIGDKQIKDGRVYAVNYEGEDLVKRLLRDNGEWWLMSDNPDQRRHPRKLCRGASCIIIGRIVHKQSQNI